MQLKFSTHSVIRFGQESLVSLSSLPGCNMKIVYSKEEDLTSFSSFDWLLTDDPKWEWMNSPSLQFSLFFLMKNQVIFLDLSHRILLSSKFLISLFVTDNRIHDKGNHFKVVEEIHGFSSFSLISPFKPHFWLGIGCLGSNEAIVTTGQSEWKGKEETCNHSNCNLSNRRYKGIPLMFLNLLPLPLCMKTNAAIYILWNTQEQESRAIIWCHIRKLCQNPSWPILLCCFSHTSSYCQNLLSKVRSLMK